MSDQYEEAIREWIARQIRRRGHKDVTRDHISDVRYAVDEGFHGSDVTPADEPTASLTCMLNVPGRMKHEHAETLDYIKPAELVEECLAIHAELQAER
jgi:hypothetical protein